MGQQSKINARWFLNHLESLDMSQRKLAKHLGLDPAAVSYFLQGKRALKLQEATEMARLFGTPIEELLSQAGLSKGPVRSLETIPVVGSIDGEGRVREGVVRGRKVAPLPAFGGSKLKVLRYQTAGTRLEAFDGALAYFKEHKNVAIEALGRLCVVEVVGRPEKLVGVVKRGYGSGHFNLFDPSGQPSHEDLELKAASPVIWLKM